MSYDPTFGKRGFALDLFQLRWKMRRPGNWKPMNQAQFAERFGLTFGMVKDHEQGRSKPSRPLKVLVAAIELNPSLIARAAKIAGERWPDVEAGE